MRGRRERSLGQLLVLASLVVLLCFAAAGACEEEEEAIGTTELPKPTEVIFRKGEGCAALATYTALSKFLATDFNTYMIDRLVLHGVDKPFIEFRYGIPGAEGYKQSAVVLHHTKYHTVASIEEVLNAFNVKPHPDLVRMKELHGTRQKEMNRLSKAARAIQKEISIIERDYLIDYDQTDALMDELYAAGVLAYDKNNEAPDLNLESEGEEALATDEVVHGHEAREIAPEPKQLLTELLVQQSVLKLAANAIRDEILPWMDSLREPLAVNRLRGVRYKFRLMEKKAAQDAAAAAAATAAIGEELEDERELGPASTKDEGSDETKGELHLE